jgi:hypothetical protein
MTFSNNETYTSYWKDNILQYKSIYSTEDNKDTSEIL